jgi:5-methylcytosine-specific restriction endonuclease McrA
VFVRDKWKCKACGCNTPQSLRGTCDPDAPELDHIIPLSRGGWHAPDNCQTLCRQCNQDKGAQLEHEWKRHTASLDTYSN